MTTEEDELLLAIAQSLDALNKKLERLERKIDAIATLTLDTLERTTHMADPQALDDLTAEVAQNTSVVGSAITLIQGFQARLDAAGEDPTKIKALSAALKTSVDALSAAVAANTPAAPPAPAAPTP